MIGVLLPKVLGYIQKSSIHQLNSLSIEFKANLSLKYTFPERHGLGRWAFKETCWEVHLAAPLQPTNHLPSHQQAISPQNISHFCKPSSIYGIQDICQQPLWSTDNTQILKPYQLFRAIIHPEVSLGLSSLQWKIAQITLISLPHSPSNPRPSSKCGCAITDNFSHFHFLYLENNSRLPSTCHLKSGTNSLLTGCQSSTGRNTTALTRQRELFVAVLSFFLRKWGNRVGLGGRVEGTEGLVVEVGAWWQNHGAACPALCFDLQPGVLVPTPPYFAQPSVLVVDQQDHFGSTFIFISTTTLCSV